MAGVVGHAAVGRGRGQKKEERRRRRRRQQPPQQRRQGCQPHGERKAWIFGKINFLIAMQPCLFVTTIMARATIPTCPPLQASGRRVAHGPSAVDDGRAAGNFFSSLVLTALKT